MATNQAPMLDVNKMGLPEKVIEYVSAASTGLQKAAEFQSLVNTKHAECVNLIPSVVEAMVQHERIEPGQREKLAALLRDPAEVLKLLVKVAAHRNRNEIATLGQGVGADGQVKTAGANGRPGQDPSRSLTSPNVGQRTTMVKQSSVNLFKRLGLGNPTSEA